MAAFTLDTSGSVPVYPWPGGEIAPTVTWSDLSPFEQGYGTAAAQELYERLIAEGWEPAKAAEAVAFRNWHPEALEQIRKDCGQAKKDFPHPELGHTGQWFWEKRQAGMWPHWTPLQVFLSDEGKVCLREAT